MFPDCNSSLNSPMAMKCCIKLETAKERCPIVFQGHPSNFKVTRYKTSPILTQIGHFPTVGRSQLSNPSDLPCSQADTRGRHVNIYYCGNISFGHGWRIAIVSLWPPGCPAPSNKREAAGACHGNLTTLRGFAWDAFCGHDSSQVYWF